MISHSELSDDVFEDQFRNCKLNSGLFNHEAHLRLAWIHITRYGVDKAIENITSQLFAYTVSLGAMNKYNETVTIAAIHAVNHFIKRSNTDNFYDLILEFPRLKNNFKDLMASHYRIDIFNSEKARKEYLQPDLLPFT